jgi:hypothetical protein
MPQGSRTVTVKFSAKARRSLKRYGRRLVRVTIARAGGGAGAAAVFSLRDAR